MKNKYVLFLFLTSAIAVYAQRPEVLSIAEAERAFAKKSVEINTRAAFLDNFDDKTIAFNNGEPVAGRAGWEQRPESNGYLNWWPVYADVAASGDWGYTTGPAVFGPDKTTQQVNGGLYYASVWRKDAQGKWKVVIDIGSSLYDPAENLHTLRTASQLPVDATPDATAASWHELERRYLSDLNATGKSFIPSWFATEARIHRPRQKPDLQPSASSNDEPTRRFSFEQAGSEMAPSGDMAFAYGRVKVATTRDGKEAIISAGYLHLWKRIGSDWKLVLDVIGS